MNRTRWLAVSLVALLGLGFWLTRSPDTELAREARPTRPAETRAEVTPPEEPAEPPTVPAKIPLAAPREHDAPTTTAAEVVGAHPHAPHAPGMLPHPVNDPERQRLHAENRLIQTLNDAMSFRRVEEMRKLIVEYQKLDPNDVHSNVAGYSIIADCIEYPGDRSLAAAREFYGQRRHSPLRRYVRRACFENTN